MIKSPSKYVLPKPGSGEIVNPSVFRGHNLLYKETRSGEIEVVGYKTSRPAEKGVVEVYPVIDAGEKKDIRRMLEGSTPRKTVNFWSDK